MCPAGAALGAGPVQSAISSFGAGSPGTSALVWRLDGSGTGTQVAGFRAETGRVPASTMKLVTSAGALLQLGPSFRFETTVVAGAGTVRRGKALVGPVYLKGSGDPVLATRSYASAYLSGRATQMAALARPLRTRGIRLVRGPIVADERIFDARPAGPRTTATTPRPSRGCPPTRTTPATGAARTSRARRSRRPSGSRPPSAASAWPRSGR